MELLNKYVHFVKIGGLLKEVREAETAPLIHLADNDPFANLAGVAALPLRRACVAHWQQTRESLADLNFIICVQRFGLAKNGAGRVRIACQMAQRP